MFKDLIGAVFFGGKVARVLSHMLTTIPLGKLGEIPYDRETNSAYFKVSHRSLTDHFKA